MYKIISNYSLVAFDVTTIRLLNTFIQLMLHLFD